MPALGTHTYLSVADVAKILGISRSGVRRYTDAGVLSCLRNPLNHYRLYRKDDIEKVLKKIRVAEQKIWIPKIFFVVLSSELINQFWRADNSVLSGGKGQANPYSPHWMPVKCKGLVWRSVHRMSILVTISSISPTLLDEPETHYGAAEECGR